MATQAHPRQHATPASAGKATRFGTIASLIPSSIDDASRAAANAHTPVAYSNIAPVLCGGLRCHRLADTPACASRHRGDLAREPDAINLATLTHRRRPMHRRRRRERSRPREEISLGKAPHRGKDDEMTAFNIVRFRVKPGQAERFLEAHRNMRHPFKGFGGDGW
jgi:hypothetical protein